MALPDLWLYVALLFGLGFCWATYRSARQSWTVLATPRTAARDVDEGAVRLRGTVRLPGEPATGPLTGEPCALARWEVRQGTGEGRLDTGLASGYAAVPFRLTDGTGAVRVVVEGEQDLFDLDIELGESWDAPVFEVLYPEEPPGRAAALEDREEVRDWPSAAETVNEWLGVKRRYHEWRVEQGDEVTVYGRARREGGTVVVEPGETFVLGTGDLARTLRFRTLVYLGTAAFFLGGSTHALGWL